MKDQNRKILFFICVGLVLAINTSAQNMETMLIEKMEQVSLVIPEKCTPEDMIIIINSSLQNLKFESNMIPNEEFIVAYNQQSNQYIICHEKIKFKLTVSGPNLQSEEIEIFDLDRPLAYRISANIAKGLVNIITNPRNAIVIFPDLNNLELSSNQPITNVSGKYRVNIVKAHYKNVDTTIIIPRDAEKTYQFDLTPQFSRIKLDLRTIDKAPFLKTPFLWIDSVKIELEALVKGSMNLRSFFDDVEFLKIYEGNIIPLNEGMHGIRIEAEGYIPYKTTLEAQKGKLHSISVILEPIFGYLTFVDKQFSEGATIFINDQDIGKIPLFKVKTRVGNYKIRFEKPGFAPSEKEYSVVVQENKNTDIDVTMLVAKKIIFDIDPTSVEVLLDGTRIGFTPFSTHINAGNHELLVRKGGFATEKLKKLINELTPDDDTVKMKLHPVYPLTIRSEQDGLLVNLNGIGDLENIEIDSSSKTPANIQLPYGKYKISLIKENKVVYKSLITHSSEILKRGKLPNYSRSTFHLLTGSYENQDNFEASFGRIHIFPGSGLSTSILNVDYKLLKINTDSINYRFKSIAPNIIFLNWDWRMGGSIVRQVDVNLLGRVKYTPGLEFLKANIPDFSDVEMKNYFYGFEVSTRLSYINICFRYGRQINIGKVHYWNNRSGKYTDDNFPIDESRNIATIGITLNGKVYNSNNMLRLWHNPLFNNTMRKSAIKE